MSPLYLDYMATTPVAPMVLKAMLPYFSEQFGNPSSLHAFGQVAREAVEQARAEVAQSLMTKPSCVTFTSGATEANNLAILGIAAKLPSHKRHIVTLATEHPSVLAPYEKLSQIGFEVTILPVTAKGLVDEARLSKILRKDTGLVSLLWVNNEIGVIQPLAKLSTLIRAQTDAYIHVDAVQAFGKVEVKLDELSIDSLTLSGHKIYGPKGIGVLWLREGMAANIQATHLGGGQEAGLRSGTLAVPLIVGMGQACLLANVSQASDSAHAQALRDGFLAGLAKLDGWQVNGEVQARVPHNLNISFEGIDSETLRIALPMLCFSGGSACQAGHMQASHVLKALGLSIRQCQGSVRFSFGRQTNMDDVAFATDQLLEAVGKLRK